MDRNDVKALFMYWKAAEAPRKVYWDSTKSL